MITCSMDKKLICVDINTGKIKYSVELDGIPLCMSVEDGGDYGSLGDHCLAVCASACRPYVCVCNFLSVCVFVVLICVRNFYISPPFSV